MKSPTQKCIYLAALLCLLQCSGSPNDSDSTDPENGSDTNPSDSSSPADTNAPAPGTPCDFSTVDYTVLGDGLDFIIGGDPDNSNCRFALHFAERLSDDSVAQIVEQGQTVDIYDVSGFMIATVDFACNTNSSGRCTADEGEAKILTFELTADDLMNDAVSGNRVQIDINARGTTPGNQALFQGVLDGVIP